MPNSKILTILIICLAIVISIWLFSRKPQSLVVVSQNATSSISVATYRNIDQNVNTDWQKILVSIDPKNQQITDLTSNNSETFDETTLTSQMAKDFFSQYLLAAKNDTQITAEKADEIANNVLTSPQYTETKGAIYLASNLHIKSKTDTDSVKKYNQLIIEIIKNRTSGVTTDPLSLFYTALQKNDEQSLVGLDPIIRIRKGMIDDFLQMDVPADAVNVHLGLLNAYSNLLSSLEGMRVVFSDPVRSFASINQYQKSVDSLKTALINMNSYFQQKLGPLK